MGLFDKIKELANSANDKYKQKIEETSANLINKSNQAAKKVTDYAEHLQSVEKPTAKDLGKKVTDSITDLVQSSKQKQQATKSHAETLPTVDEGFSDELTEDDSNEPDPVFRKGLNQLNGLSIGEVILLDWQNGKAPDAITPGYFPYVYGINAPKARRNLINKELLVPAPPEIAIKSLKVTDLKKILSSNSLPMTGRKADLIQRILTKLPTASYSAELPKVLTLSEKGQSIESKASILIWASKQKNLSISLAKFIPYLPAEQPFEPIAIKLVTTEFSKNLKCCLFGLATNNASSLQSLEQSMGNTKEALYYLIVQAMLDFQATSSNAENDFYASAGDESQIGFIQGYVLDFTQRHEVDNQQIIQALARYKSEIQPYLPNYVWMNDEQMQFAFDKILTGEPGEISEIQATFLKSNVPADHLFIRSRSQRPQY